MNSERTNEIAVIGMSGRFPKAPDLTTFWRNLRDGLEGVSFFLDEELEQNGVNPSLLHDPHYVKAKAILEDAEMFDASFFGFSPREAELTDPQIRLFLEAAWSVLENAGYPPDNFPGLIGVYAGMSLSSYMWPILASNMIDPMDAFRAAIGADKDHLSTWVSYKLNLRGPSLNVQTACSTSLVAVHLACRALMTFECDLALAGGVSLAVPQRVGYLYQPGGISSSDGRCRAFADQADGSVSGEGLGVILLKRLDDALASGDSICAVVKGSAVNNDGNRKVGYTAPAVDGQADVISAAQAMAGAGPETIDYVEAHGSGTTLGDPIEIAALNQAFRRIRDEKGSIPIGSVKTNIGHLGPAAGIAGFVKTVLSIQHGWIPPSLHCDAPNPRIPFDKGPFQVNKTLLPWPSKTSPRRAGVSSFGIGGTNVHVVIEEAPKTTPSDPCDAPQLFVISARSESAIERATDQLAEHLNAHSDHNIADVAFTLQAGRKGFEYRRMGVFADGKTAARCLGAREPSRVFTRKASTTRRPIAFLFPGLGDHYPDMGRGLYESEPEYRSHVDRCSEMLMPYLDIDLREALYPPQRVRGQVRERLDFRSLVEHVSQPNSSLSRNSLAQSALFVTEYSLAKLWISWGIVPEAMLGYSVGEYVAACLSGVLSLADSLLLVATRARTIERLPRGAMLAVAASEEEVRSLLVSGDLFIAGVNGASMCVVAGTVEAIDSLEERICRERELVCRRLQTEYAFHSPLMQSIADELTELVRQMPLQPPQIPYLSNVSGTWITSAQVSDPSYWARHLCEPVRFSDGLEQLSAKGNPILIEVGPGNMLSSIAEQYLATAGSLDRVIVPSLPHAADLEADRTFVLRTLGQIWLAGVEPDWSKLHFRKRRRRVPLPTYPFEHNRYWLAPSAKRQDIRSRRDSEPESLVCEPNKPSPENRNGQSAESMVFPVHPRPNLGVTYVAAEDPVSQRITQIWENLFGIRPIGIHDNFFRLGGNSLLGIRVVSELRKTFQIDLPVQALLAASTIEALTLVVEDALITSVESVSDIETH